MESVCVHQRPDTCLEERHDGAGPLGVGGLEHVALIGHHHLCLGWSEDR